MSTQEVLYEVRDHVAWLTLNRPERRNALNGAAVHALLEAFGTAASDPAVRAIVLTGSGDKAFCAGGDLTDMGGGTGGGIPPFKDLLLAMHESPRPIVARVNGLALGGGLGLAMNCDVVVASPDAKFGTPEIGVGLYPWMILPVLAEAIPGRALTRMVLGGGRIGAAEALALGMISAVSEDLDAACAAELGPLLDACPPVLARGLPNLRHLRRPHFRKDLEGQEAHFAWNMTVPELLEGVSAFIERRKPSWTLSNNG